MPWDEREFRQAVARWVSLHPTAQAPDACRAIVEEVTAHLVALGFSTQAVFEEGHAPVLLARRPPPPGGATLGIYNHYNVEPVRGRWTHEPLGLHAASDRLFGRGVADNLGPLALRLLAARDVSRWPGVLWVIEGEEEVGSSLLTRHAQSVRSETDIALWLDETGYFEDARTQRYLTLHEDDSLRGLVRTLAEASRGITPRVESRRLRRVSPAGVSAAECLFGHAPYLAIGPNDPAASIHGGDESLPRWSLRTSAAQFVATLEWYAREGAP